MINKGGFVGCWRGKIADNQRKKVGNDLQNREKAVSLQSILYKCKGILCPKVKDKV